MTHAADILTEAFDYAVEELDGFMARLTAADPVLELEHDGSHWWIVNATSGTWMYRSADLWSCFRFARAFMRKTAGARLGDSLAHIGSVPGVVEQALTGSEAGARSGVRTPVASDSRLGDPTAVEPRTQAPVPQAGSLAASEPASPARPGAVNSGRTAAPPDSFSVRVPSNVIPIGGRG